MLAKDRKEHDYEMLWHIDSDLEMCSGAGCSFADINVCVSGECSSLQVVCGEEKPEWQGFVSTGFEQGCYREVNCIRAVKRGENLRTVTVLYPTVDSELRIVGVEAGENPEDTNLILRLSDGKEIELKETEAEK